MRRALRSFAVPLLVWTLAACGTAEDEATEDITGGAEELLDDAESGDVPSEDEVADMAENMAEDLEAVQEERGGGSATLTVGDETYRFDSVLCAFGEDEIGQEGAEVVVSSLQDGTQFYVSVDSFGHSVSLNDIENFEDPSVNLSTFGADDFISVDGGTVSGDASFVDGTSDAFEEIPGSFEVTCP